MPRDVTDLMGFTGDEAARVAAHLVGKSAQLPVLQQWRIVPQFRERSRRQHAQEIAAPRPRVHQAVDIG